MRQHPDGVCIATPRGVTCWDPPVSAYCADDKPIPRPRCLSVSGRAACGYDCRAKMARSPAPPPRELPAPAGPRPVHRPRSPADVRRKALQPRRP